jgi:AraC-like DNA-binding protein
VLRNDIIRCYFQAILLKIKEFFLNNNVSKTNRISSVHPKIIEFKKLINSNYTNHYTAFQYAKALNISPNYLNSLCKKETGKTVTELVHERLLLESKRLLYSTKLNVKEISNQLNFDSVAYFSRFFKKQVGQTPLDYRHSSGK